jgi:parallel beta-helix repeat protein
MDKKYRLLVLCALILVLCLVGVVSGETWYVDDDGRANFMKIQDAIDNATAGDSIIVRDGTYIENVDVYVDNVTISSVNGSDFTIVQAANSSDHVFEVSADYVNISGFTVNDSTEYRRGGIYLGRDVDHCTISHNNVTGNSAGIYLSLSRENNVSNNIVSNNIEGGIHLSNSYSNAFINNTFMNDGFIVLGSHQNTMINNRVNGKPLVYLEDASDYMVEEAGQVILVNCNNITVKNVNISHTCVGVQLSHTSNSRITNITANWNSQYGIFLGLGSNNNMLMVNTVNSNEQGIRLDSKSNDNLLINNTINSNYDGISLTDTSNTLLTKNTANSNYYGIYLRSSSDNVIYLNNFVNNTHNIDSYESANNTLNSEDELSYNLSGTLYTNYLGNYWDDYEVKYPDAEEIDGTGIWNTPYDIDGDSDNYPLVEPFENYFE